jgi:hypothetical protein
LSQTSAVHGLKNNTAVTNTLASRVCYDGVKAEANYAKDRAARVIRLEREKFGISALLVLRPNPRHPAFKGFIVKNAATVRDYIHNVM